MSSGAGKRKAVAEIVWGDSRNPVARVGTRTVHHYWTLLAPHFRSVWLPPQRQSDDRGVSWTWNQVADAPAMTAAELAEVRQRMAGALDGARDDPSFGSVDSAVIAAVADVVTGLLQKRDGQLAPFVCRTEAGLRLHSWGAAVAAVPFFPNDLERLVSGVLLVGDKDPSHLEVVLENRKGLVVARVRADAAGTFEFKPVGAGSYRVRVVADRVDFPVSGLEVEVGRSSVTGLKLRSTALNIAAEKERAEQEVRRSGAVGGEDVDTERAVSAAPPLRRTRRWVVAGAWAGAGALVLAGGWFWTAAEKPGGRSPDVATLPTAGGAREAGGSEGARGVGGEPPLVGTSVTAAVGGRKIEADRGGAAVAEGGGGGRSSGSASAPAAAKSARSAAGAATAARTEESAISPVPSENTPGAPVAASRRPGQRGSPAARDDQGALPPSPSDGKSATLPKPEKPAGEAASSATEATPSAAAASAAKRGAAKDHAGAGDSPANSNSPGNARGGGGLAGRSESAGRGDGAKPESAPLAGGASAESAQSDPAGSQGGRAANETSAEAGGGESSPAVARARPGDQTPTATPAPSSAEQGGTAGSEYAAAPGMGRVGWLRISDWKDAGAGDEIVPTLPVFAGEDDGLEQMRERLLQDRGRSSSPRVKPSTWHGIVLALPESDGLRWRRPADAAAVETGVRGNRAEIGWRSGPRERAGEFVLEAAAGRAVARVRISMGGIVEVDMIPGGKAGGWIGVENFADDRVGPVPEARRRRGEWTRGARGALPAGWQPDSDWRGGVGRRIDFPLEAGAPRRELEFHDAATAWTIRCEVEIR